MTNLTLILLTKNESENIKKNFDWLNECPRINEIIAVDDNSEDETIQILKSLESKTRKVKIFSRGLEGNFSAQRQFAISKSGNNWIFWLDADERPSTRLIGFINHIDLSLYYNFAFKRSDIFLGRKLKYGETSSQIFLRLFDKNYGRFEGRVHEIWQSQKKVIQKYDLEILHNSHSNLTSFLQKINYYTDIRAKELLDRGVQSNIFQIIFFPLAKFIQNYLFRLGFLDSTPGIILALGMSFHSFLVRSKLWHLQQK